MELFPHEMKMLREYTCPCLLDYSIENDSIVYDTKDYIQLYYYPFKDIKDVLDVLLSLVNKANELARFLVRVELVSFNPKDIYIDESNMEIKLTLKKSNEDNYEDSLLGLIKRLGGIKSIPTANLIMNDLFTQLHEGDIAYQDIPTVIEKLSFDISYGR